jgi:hypothetical protein
MISTEFPLPPGPYEREETFCFSTQHIPLIIFLFALARGGATVSRTSSAV